MSDNDFVRLEQVLQIHASQVLDRDCLQGEREKDWSKYCRYMPHKYWTGIGCMMTGKQTGSSFADTCLTSIGQGLCAWWQGNRLEQVLQIYASQVLDRDWVHADRETDWSKFCRYMPHKYWTGIGCRMTGKQSAIQALSWACSALIIWRTSSIYNNVR